MLSTQKFTLPIVILSIWPAMCAFAGVRHFTFLYEAPTSPPGSIEVENTVTWAHGAGWNDAFIREELEIGITDRLQLGIPRLSVGVEFLHEFIFPDWRDEQTIRNVFVGPNVSYRQHSWFVTVTALAQATDTADEADFQLRTIFGIGF